MLRLFTQLPVMLALILSCTFVRPAAGQAVSTSANCASYFAAIVGDAAVKESASVPPVDDRLLADWRTAMPCLVTYLKTLQTSVASPNLEAFPSTLGKFLRATGAVRTIMANNSSQLSDIIQNFRGLTDLSVTSVLTYGARSDDYNARLNSMFILANVIDNTTVCVPLDHLYDPSISQNGRANLLGIVSVVAPWAYRENFDNISRLLAFMVTKISKDDPDLRQTNEILSNIDLRLKSQTNDSNKGVYLPPSLQKCKSYKPEWANRTADNLHY